VDRSHELVVVFLSAQWFLPRKFFAALADAAFSGLDQA
jgi:hypothetical protein